MTAVGRHWPLAAPAAAAAAFVLTVYVDQGALLFELVRPLAVALALLVTLQLLLTLALRRAVLAAVLALGVVSSFIDARLVLVWLAIVIARELMRRRGTAIDIARPVAAVALILFAVATIRTVTSEAFVLTDLRAAPVAAGGTTRAGDPDIFLLMLDGYPRSDTLAALGYDNTWFEDELAERGFEIAAASRSSYSFTGLTVTSMLNMDHLPDIDGLYPAPATHVGHTRALVERSNESLVLRTLEGRGYWTVSAGLTEVRGTIRNVDQYVDDGEIRFWERQVLQRTSVWEALCDALIVPQHRSLIESTFSAVEDVATTTHDSPVFMFAHVLSPHTPIVFDRDGGPTKAGSGSCSHQFHVDATLIGLDEETFGHAMSDQVHYLNTRTLGMLDRLLEARPDATIVVFSDHGMRYSSEVTDEWFRSFFAARTPGHDGLFGEDARPIDLFPTLFNAYFGTTIPLADDRSFTSTHGIWMPLDLTAWASAE